MSRSDSAPRHPVVLDSRFTLERLVGKGGMGRVYYALDRHSGQPVAVKLLASEEPQAHQRFLHEARALAETHHPGIVRYVAHGVAADGVHYLAMEWLEGEDLSRHLRRRAAGSRDPAARQIPLAMVLQLGRRLAAAMATLHDHGVVHRDIKPSNLFLVGGALDQVKLIDFGTVQDSSERARMTQPGQIIGSLNYMAPEQARAKGQISPATDVWAIGCVLYECLSGARAFPGKDLLVVLTRIVLEQPEPIHALCPDAPPALLDLIERAMSKSPADRPAHAGELARTLDVLAKALAVGAGDTAVSQTPRAFDATFTSELELTSEIPTESRTASIPRPLRLTSAESRVLCMLFARGHQGAPDDPVIGQAVAATGASFQHLANGTLLVTIPDSRAPTDQAVQAARTALALRKAVPAVAMALATGYTDGPGQCPHQVVAHAASALDHAPPGHIHIDELTATLIEPRFHTGQDQAGRHLIAERRHEAMRTLLGKPAPWVGRRRELAHLQATFDECVTEEVARAIVITGAAGMGKSRLRYELEQVLHQRGDDFEVLRGHGEVVSAGAPFVMIAPAIRRLAGIRDGEPVTERQRKLRAHLARTVPPADLPRIAAFLGEMIGTPFADDAEPSLHAARHDAMLLGQCMQTAWIDWLRIECSHRPVLLLLEDLHWGDLPSVQYVDSALRALQDAPFMVLALARPEVHTAFPNLWAQRDAEEMPLHPLSPKAATRMVRGVLGPDVPDDVARTVVERGNGNAFYLEELIRVVAEAGPRPAPMHLPATILGMVQARLDALGPAVRRVLRAASVFGEVFWEGGVIALLGEGGAFGVHEWLGDLVEREIVLRRPEARLPGEVEYKFTHALVRDGAYALLTADDRRLGHDLAGKWLELAGEPDSLILAEHFVRGDNPERAIPCFHRAAAQALEGNDLAAVVQRAERAIEAGARGEVLGALRSLQCVASFWLSDYTASQAHGLAAMRLLPRGSAAWFTVMGSTIVPSARLGDHSTVDRLFQTALNSPCAPGAEVQRLICVCRGSHQVISNGHDYKRSERLHDRIFALIGEVGEMNALARAQVAQMHAGYASSREEFAGALDHQANVVAELERAGDLRNVAMERTTLAWMWTRLGFFERAVELARRNLAFCDELGISPAQTFAKVHLGHALSRCSAPGSAGMAQARRLLEDGVREGQEAKNHRLEGWAHGYLAWLERAEGRREAERRAASHAMECLAASPGLRVWAVASHARALLAVGRLAEARAEARAAMAQGARLPTVPQSPELPPLVLALALNAGGEQAGALAAITDAAHLIERRAARITRPGWREQFLRIAENRQTFELYRAWRAEAEAQ